MERWEVYISSYKELIKKPEDNHDNQKCMYSTEKTEKETRQECERKLKKWIWDLIWKQLIPTNLSLKRK